MTLSFPAALGRSVVIGTGSEAPAPWADAPLVVIDRALLDDSEKLALVADRMHRAWVGRQPLAIQLDVDPAVLRDPEVSTLDPWRLRRGFSFNRERLHYLVWANSYDSRNGELIWWWGRKAMALGADADETADVRLPDGRPAWVDGGPRGPILHDDDVVVHAESITQGLLEPAPNLDYSALDGLAPDQREAAAHLSGPARIIAPAGSGKTRTLTARIRHLIDDRGVEPKLICALAYNNRAAAEMRERLGDQPGLKVRTIHSLGWEILREARGNVVLLDEREQRRRLDRLVEAPRRPNADTIGPYLEALGEVRIGLRPPDEVEAFRDDVPGFARVFERYRALLDGRREADFDEQVYGAIEALLTLPELRHRWQERCRHMVVDEFQDLTPAYVLLIRLLGSPELNVFGVGDDDQVIYGYLGADPGYLIEYDGLFPGSVSHPLEVNYRCPPSVVDAASNLLGYNKRRVDKVIRAAGDSDEDGGLNVDVHPGAELALQTAVRVGAWLQDTPAEEIAVLCRVNSSLLPVHVAFVEAGIPFRSALGREVLERTVMAAALAWIRIGLGPDAISTSDLMKVVRRPARGLTRLTSQLVGRRRKVSLDDLFQIGSQLDGKQATKWDAFCDDVATVAEVATRGDTIAMLDVITDEIGLSGAAAALDAGRRRADRSAQSDDLVALRRAAVMHQELTGFESWLRSALDHRNDDGGIEVSTVHRVKGMEWDRVVVFGVERGLFPHDLAEDVEEERRVFHVAITRGRKEVVVLVDKSRPSRFVRELTGKAPQVVEEPSTAKRSIARGMVVTVGDRVRIAGGYSGVVEEFEDEGAVVALDAGSSSMLVAWGESITTPGGSGPLARPPEPTELDETLVDRLKAWRLEVAVANAVPAYVVMNDKTLLAIATAKPAREAELIALPGIGPSKLENYGDEILALCSD